MGWIGTSFLLLGRYLMRKEGRTLVAWLLTCIGDFIWMIVGVQIQQTPVWFTGGLMGILDIMGLLGEFKKRKKASL